jgi:DNA polymerase
MGLSERDARLWEALGLGPVWRERASGPARPEAGADPGCDPVAGMDWDALAGAVAACTACGLCRTRTQTVFGAGSRRARWMFIGEAPGAEEDARGEPFVGQAGRLLDNMLAEAGLGRDRDAEVDAGGKADANADAAVYIANVLKCRPPGNRNPDAAEVTACAPFLARQIALLDPALIVVMGRFATHSLLGTDASLGSLRGRVHEYRSGGRRYPVIVTYHPAYLLRNLADKARSWEDLCLARDTFAAIAPVARATP